MVNETQRTSILFLGAVLTALLSFLSSRDSRSVVCRGAFCRIDESCRCDGCSVRTDTSPALRKQVDWKTGRTFDDSGSTDQIVGESREVLLHT
jgi:hypothetical protein